MATAPPATMRKSVPPDHAARMARARLATDGLSVGDSFGQRFFAPQFQFRSRDLPPPPWLYTDDTEMALGILQVLGDCGGIDQDRLAAVFAARYTADPARGYGAGAQEILRGIARGEDWQTASRNAFSGQGSIGNGGAMRAAPVGAYFADDLERVAHQARLSAEITHAHPEGQAGAIAVAVAAAWAHQRHATRFEQPSETLLETAAGLTPASEVREGLLRARDVPLDEWNHTAASILGNGSRVTAADTVPFCLWCAAANVDNFPEALWSTVHVRGDIDTNCAIVGGIVALAGGREAIPAEWIASREPLQYKLTPP